MTNNVIGEVLGMIALHEGCDETDLPALHNSVDVDALEALIASSDEVDVRFVYAGYRIRVTGDGEVDVSPIN